MVVAIFGPSITALSAHLSSVKRKHLDLSNHHLFVQRVCLIYAVDIALTTILGTLYQRHLGHNELKWIYGASLEVKSGWERNFLEFPALFCTAASTKGATVHLAGYKIDTEEPGNLFGLVHSCYRPVKQPSCSPRGILGGI